MINWDAFCGWCIFLSVIVFPIWAVCRHLYILDHPEEDE